MTRHCHPNTVRLLWAVALALVLQVQPALANDPAPLIQSATRPTTAVNAIDLRLELARLPEESQKALLSDRDRLKLQSSNMFVLRALAVQAEQQGLEKSPDTTALLQLARDRVLAEARLAKIDQQATPDAKVLEKLAQTQYRATDPKKYTQAPQVRARHILVSNTKPDAKDRANALRQQLIDGADFVELAKIHSDDPGSAAKGGDLGFFAQGRMVKPFEDALAPLKTPGELSPVVETQFGFHIIRFEERTPVRVPTFAEIKATLEQEIVAKLRNDARARENERILKDAQFNEAAFEQFTATAQQPKQ